MPAQRTRRFFAAPFVVTVVAGCQPEAARPPETPLSTAAPIASAPASPLPTATPSASPTAAPVASAPVAPDHDESWLVEQKGKKCVAQRSPDCSQFPCTSSTPKEYPCPPAAEFPVTVTRAAGQTVCIVETSPREHCPPGWSCNPPPPTYEKVACPEK